MVYVYAYSSWINVGRLRVDAILAHEKDMKETICLYLLQPACIMGYLPARALGSGESTFRSFILAWSDLFLQSSRTDFIR